MKTDHVGTFFGWFQCELVGVSSISFMLSDTKCPLKKLLATRYLLVATILQKEVLKRKCLKTSRLEHCAKDRVQLSKYRVHDQDEENQFSGL